MIPLPPAPPLNDRATLEANPVAQVRFVPRDQVTANDYNPNSVPRNELALLKTSVLADGYTQPTVTVWDGERGVYVVVDGFHRWLISGDPEVQEKLHLHGLLPIVVLDKPLAERMASTVRHNRARGKHSVAGMASLVFGMLEEGKTDDEVIAELGLSRDELLRLKHVTGFAKLWESAEYQKAWWTRRQIQLRRDYAASHPDEEVVPV